MDRGRLMTEPTLGGNKGNFLAKGIPAQRRGRISSKCEKNYFGVIMADRPSRRESRAERPGGEMGQRCGQEEEGLDEQAMGLGWM